MIGHLTRVQGGGYKRDSRTISGPRFPLVIRNYGCRPPTECSFAWNEPLLGGEEVRAFVPAPLPPHKPHLIIDPLLARALDGATAALGQLSVAGGMVQSPGWFLYGFVRKEALITSQIEGTQATLHDVLAFEAGQAAKRPEDVEEVCNYVAALDYARREIARPRGLPLCTRLLCEAHKRLMRGVRGSDKRPGGIRACSSRRCYISACRSNVAIGSTTSG